MINLQSINTRKEKAWHELFSMFYAPLCVYVEKIIGNHDDAEDIVQDTMLKIWSSEVTFTSEAHLSYYLYRSAHNNTISLCRKNKKSLLTDIALQNDEFVDEAYNMAVKEELYRQLYVAINQLPSQQRSVIELSIEGKSGKEIAELLGISIHTVKAHKQKALDSLRKNASAEAMVFFLLCIG